MSLLTIRTYGKQAKFFQNVLHYSSDKRFSSVAIRVTPGHVRFNSEKINDTLSFTNIHKGCRMIIF
jgi:hypothetical protein